MGKMQKQLRKRMSISLKIYMMVVVIVLGIGSCLGCASKALSPQKTDEVTWNIYSGGKCSTDDNESIIEVPCRDGDVMIPRNDLSNLVDKIISQCN